MKIKTPFWIAVVVWMLGGCTQHHGLANPKNPGDMYYGTRFEQGTNIKDLQPASLSFATDVTCENAEQLAAAVEYRVDNPKITYSEEVNGRNRSHQIFNRSMPLSQGDLVSVDIAFGEGISGEYVVNPDGFVELAYVGSVEAAGISTEELAEAIELELIRKEIFRPHMASVSVRVLSLAPIDVSVVGAVFQPGRVVINQKIQAQIVEQFAEAYGDNSSTRYLSEALRAAAGVRPDAKLDQIIVVRNGWQLQVDMSGMLNGAPVHDLALVKGDRVIVPTTGCFQSQLVRPSQITPKGFRVFMSNLIVPSLSNSNSAVGRYSSNLPYGSRLLQAAVSANCVGGTEWTNAPRKVVLAGRNPLTGQIQVVERSIEQLFRQAHVEAINPYLMPNDSVACYDSDVSNLRDIARSIADVISPLTLL